jgi:hypothetical protein
MFALTLPRVKLVITETVGIYGTAFKPPILGFSKKRLPTYMSPFMEGNSNQGHFLRTLRSKGEKIFRTAVWVEASNVAAAASIDIPHLFDNPIAFNKG